MVSPVDICNLALSFLGDDASVASIDPPEESAQAQICSRLYPQAVLALLEMHDWSFATKKAKPAPLLNGPKTAERTWRYCNGRTDRDRLRLQSADTHGWRRVFEVPSDCLRIISVEDDRFQRGRLPSPMRGAIDGVLGTTLPFEVQAAGKTRVFYCDSEHPVITYISSETAPALFSPVFVQALAWYLAASLAGSLIKGKEGQQMVQNCLKEFQAFLSVAKSADASQQKKRTEFIPRWILMR